MAVGWPINREEEPPAFHFFFRHLATSPFPVYLAGVTRSRNTRLVWIDMGGGRLEELGIRGPVGTGELKAKQAAPQYKRPDQHPQPEGDQDIALSDVISRRHHHLSKDSDDPHACPKND